MRLLRALAMAAVFAALFSRPGAAQDARQFKDAWFWGIKGGALSFSSTTTTNSGAPLVGGEWLITRSQGGLYVSYDQAFLTTQGGFLDHDPDSTFTRPVRLKDLRRFTIAGMVFPIQSRVLHPYAGLGLLFNQIGGTQLLSPVANPVRYQIALDSIQARKAGFSPILLAGVQARLHPFSVFVQGTASPMQRAFFLSNDASPRSFNVSLELGVRYNMGSAIDRAR